MFVEAAAPVRTVASVASAAAALVFGSVPSLATVDAQSSASLESPLASLIHSSIRSLQSN